ncbi:membrane protein [Lactococcus phage RH6]|nr:membrane protein [Lactococcus phage RH6]QPL22604.1 membrane protein [Lactococcus phage FB10]
MKDTVKTLMIVVGVGFTLIAITWVGMVATLLITWLGGNI